VGESARGALLEALFNCGYLVPDTGPILRLPVSTLSDSVRPWRLLQ